MKYILIVLGLALSVPAFAGVNVSINVGQPGFFGRIDIAGAPPPLLLAPRPVIITPPGISVNVDPLYLHVRPEESRNWRRYCQRYDACGRQVYFVKDTWYRNVYVPHYHAHHDEYVRRDHDRMERARIEQERVNHAHQDQHVQEHHDDHHNDHPANPHDAHHNDDHHDNSHDNHHDDHDDNH